MSGFTTNFRLSLPNFNLFGWHDDINNNLRTIDVALKFATQLSGVSGAWTNGTAYVVGDKLVDAELGTVWRCLVNNTAPATGTFAAYRTANPSHWLNIDTGYAVRGAWAGSTLYTVGDLVYNLTENVVALCIVEHTSSDIRTDQAAGKWVFAADLKAAVDYVDSQISGRMTVRVATTANITIATALNSGDTIDGVTLADGDLVLVKNQSTASQNGVYTVSSSPVRSTLFDTWNEHPGSIITVQEGTQNADTIWLCTSNRGGTLGTTSITFVQLNLTGELLIANNLSDVASAATAFTNIKQAASETATGVVELATQAEAIAGGDTTRAVHPTGLVATVDNRSGVEVLTTAPSANQNDFSSGASVRKGVLSILEVTPTISMKFTGISTSGWDTGKRIIIRNATSRTGANARLIILERNSASSAAANRFNHPGSKRLPLTIMPGEMAEFYFNGTQLELIHSSRPNALSGYFDYLFDAINYFDHWITGDASGTYAGVMTDENGEPFTYQSSRTGTGATNRAFLADNTNTVRIGQTAVLFMARVSLPLLSDATEEFDAFAGFLDHGATMVDYIGWFYDRNTQTTWQTQCISNSAATVQNVAGLTVTAGRAPVLGVFVNGDGTRADFFYSDDGGATWIFTTAITTNIPNTSARHVGFGTGIIKSAGTTLREFRMSWSGRLGWT